MPPSLLQPPSRDGGSPSSAGIHEVTGSDSPRVRIFFGQCFLVGAVLTGFHVGDYYGLSRPRYVYLAFVLGLVCVLASDAISLQRVKLVISSTLFVLWSVAAMAWTTDRTATWFYLRTVCATVLMTMVVSSLLGPRHTVRAYTFAFKVAAAASVLVILIEPSTRQLLVGAGGSGAH